jgi:hypothetical protein
LQKKNDKDMYLHSLMLIRDYSYSALMHPASLHFYITAHWHCILQFRTPSLLHFRFTVLLRHCAPALLFICNAALLLF